MDNRNIILALGSNVGDKKENILKALKFLEANGVKKLKLSSFYETRPVIFENQPNFINAAGIFSSHLSPFKLLRLAKQIEKRMGRENKKDKGPRIIDIDIIFYGRICLYSHNLVIPHPAYKERLFVLQPIEEIAPELVPVNETSTITQLVKQCIDKVSNPVKTE